MWLFLEICGGAAITCSSESYVQAADSHTLTHVTVYSAGWGEWLMNDKVVCMEVVLAYWRHNSGIKEASWPGFEVNTS
jgi:hypothetical protein